MINLTVLNVLCTLLVSRTVSENYDDYNATNYLEFYRTEAPIYDFRAVGHVVERKTSRYHVFITHTEKFAKVRKAFCSGTIISEKKVVSAAVCFYTNQKRLKRPLEELQVVAGWSDTVQAAVQGKNEWKPIKRVVTQEFFRYPVNNLAVVVLRLGFEFDINTNKNSHVRPLRYATLDQEFDGNCKGFIVKTKKSWKSKRTLYWVDMAMVSRARCSADLLQRTDDFYCTAFEEIPEEYYKAVPGAGLVCFKTKDPYEWRQQGLLVGVTTVAHRKLYTLHARVGPHTKWITNITA